MTIPLTRLGRTGLQVSRLCLGTMTFGLQTNEAEARAILDKASDAGVNFIDTADVYPLGGDLQTVGRTEDIVGRWLSQSSSQRHNYVLATKGVGRTGPNPWDQGASRKHLLEAIDASLKRLGTDYVDLYQLHSDDAATPLDETVSALDTIVKSGRARYIGVSNFLAWRLAKALGVADARHATRFVSVQPRYSLLFREIERELLPMAAEEGLGVLPYNPLAGGLLTAKYRFHEGPQQGTRFTLGTAKERYQDRYWQQRMFDTVDSLRRAAADYGISLTTAAVAWVLSHPVVTAPIIGASCADQLDATLAAASVALEPALKARFDELTVEYRYGDALR